MKTLDKPWQDWIVRNIALGYTHNDMLNVMLTAGILESTALFNFLRP